MDVFVKKFQPDRYEQWLAGRDVVPINHSRPTPEAKEFLGDCINDITSGSSSCSLESCGEDGERKRWVKHCTCICRLIESLMGILYYMYLYLYYNKGSYDASEVLMF